MTRPRIVRLLAVLAGLVVLAFVTASPARAQSCSFSVNNVAFGPVDTLSGAARDTAATVFVSCGGALLGAQARICLSLNAGNGGSSGSTRLMRHASGTGTLAFQLYQDAARAVPWGSVEQTQFGQPLALNLTLPALSGTVSTTRTIYARVLPNQQTAAPGVYSSTFSASHVRFSYIFYIGTPPPCGTFVPIVIARPTFTVTATVAPNCLVSAQDINFGTRGVLDAPLDAAGAIAARCTPGTPYTIGLNGGLTGAPPTQRRMTRGASSILYGLYRNSTRTLPWGDDTATRQSGLGTGLSQNLPVHGHVPAQPTPPPGIYGDTVVVTVRY